MKRGLVVGEIWATRKASGLDGRQLKLVVEYPAHGPLTAAALGLAPLVVAVDTLDVRRGQEVLIAYGSGARNVLSPGPDNRHELCDAAVALLPEDDRAGDPQHDRASDPQHDRASDPQHDRASDPQHDRAGDPAGNSQGDPAGDANPAAHPVADRAGAIPR